MPRKNATDDLREYVEQARRDTENRREYRAALDARVEQAQKAYLDLARVGLSRTPEAVAAMECRDALEAELIALDDQMQWNREVDRNWPPRYTVLEQHEKEWKRALSLAANCGDAVSVANALEQLEKIWAEKDSKKGL